MVPLVDLEVGGNPHDDWYVIVDEEKKEAKKRQLQAELEAAAAAVPTGPLLGISLVD